MITALFRPVFGYMVAIAVMVAGFEIWLVRHDARVRETVVTDINQQTEKIGADAIAARDAANSPGAFARLRRDSCANCKAGVPKGDPTCVH